MNGRVASAQITPEELAERIGTASAPLLVDVRRRAVFDAAERMIAGARWRDHMAVEDWLVELSPAPSRAPGTGQPGTSGEVVVYCVHGHQVSLVPCARLRAMGFPVRFLSGGFEAYCSAGGATIARHARAPSGQWLVPLRPGPADLARAWVVRRFVDPNAEILFVPRDWLVESAAELNAEVLGGPLANESIAAQAVARTGGAGPGIDALVARFAIDAPGLGRLASIVRDLEPGTAASVPEAAGLRAVMVGLGRLEADDQLGLDRGLGIYDALYAWARLQGGAARAGSVSRGGDPA